MCGHEKMSIFDGVVCICSRNKLVKTSIFFSRRLRIRTGTYCERSDVLSVNYNTRYNTS